MTETIFATILVFVLIIQLSMIRDIADINEYIMYLRKKNINNNN